MKRSALWLGLLITIFITGGAFTLSEEERSEKITDFTEELLASFGEDSESVIQALGRPVKIKMEKELNHQGEGVEDVFEGLKYEGLSLMLATTGKAKRHWVLDLTCSSDCYALRGVRVGDALDKVLEALGDPAEKTPKNAVYETDFVSLILELDPQETIKKIEAHFFLD